MPTDTSTTKHATTIKATVETLRAGESQVVVTHNRKNFQSLATLISGLESYKTALEKMLAPSILAAIPKPRIITIDSVLAEHAALDMLFSLLKEEKITYTQFLILMQINQIEAVIKEISSIKKSWGTIDYKTIVETYSSLSIAYKSGKYFEQISQIDPVAFNTFKILNHYAVAGLLKSTYTVSHNELEAKEKIEKAVASLIYKIIDYKQSEKKYSTLSQLLHAEIDLILKAITQEKHTGALEEYSPIERILIKEIAHLAEQTKKLTPKHIAKFISETWLPTFANFQFDLENKDKLKTYIAALILLNKDVTSPIKSSMFKAYLEVCFPGNPKKVELYLDELDQHIKKQDKLVLTSSEELKADLKNIEDNILFLNASISQHKEFAHFVEPSTLTLSGWLESNLHAQLLTMQGQGKDSPAIMSSLREIQATVDLVKQPVGAAVKLQKIISLLRTLAINFNEKTPIVYQALISTLKILEDNIVQLFDADETVRTKAQTLLIAELSEVLAKHHNYPNIAEFAGNFIKLIKTLYATSDQSQQNEIIGEFLGQVVYDLSKKITSSAASKTLSFLRNLFRKKPTDQQSHDVTRQTTSDEYEFLHKELRHQQQRLERYIQDLNHHAQALLLVAIEPSKIIIPGDGPLVLRDLIASPLYEELPLPYLLEEQLKLLQDLEQMHAKLQPLCKDQKDLVVSKDNITREMQVAYADLAKNCTALQTNADKLRNIIQEIYLSHLKSATKKIFDQELDQGSLIEDSAIDYHSSVLSKSMTKDEFEARQARYKIYSTILNAKVIDDELLNAIKQLDLAKKNHLNKKLKTAFFEQVAKITLIHDFNTKSSCDLSSLSAKKSLSIVRDSFEMKLANYGAKISYIIFKLVNLLFSASRLLYRALTWPIRALKNVINLIAAFIKRRRPESKAFKQELDQFIQAINQNTAISEENKKTILTKIKILSDEIGKIALSSLKAKLKNIQDFSVSECNDSESDDDASKTSLPISQEPSDNDTPSDMPASSTLTGTLFKKKLIIEKNQYISSKCAQITPLITKLKEAITTYRESLNAPELPLVDSALKTEKMKKLDILLAKVEALSIKVAITHKDTGFDKFLTAEEAKQLEIPLKDISGISVDKEYQSKLDITTDSKTLEDLHTQLNTIQAQEIATQAPQLKIRRIAHVGAAAGVQILKSTCRQVKTTVADGIGTALHYAEPYVITQAQAQAAESQLQEAALRKGYRYAKAAVAKIGSGLHWLWTAPLPDMREVTPTEPEEVAEVAAPAP